jgi:hypothetical protein
MIDEDVLAPVVDRLISQRRWLIGQNPSLIESKAEILDDKTTDKRLGLVQL